MLSQMALKSAGVSKAGVVGAVRAEESEGHRGTVILCSVARAWRGTRGREKEGARPQRLLNLGGRLPEENRLKVGLQRNRSWAERRSVWQPGPQTPFLARPNQLKGTCRGTPIQIAVLDAKRPRAHDQRLSGVWRTPSSHGSYRDWRGQAPC